MDTLERRVRLGKIVMVDSQAEEEVVRRSQPDHME